MANKKAVCVVTGTRAEYGLLRPLIDKLYNSAVIELRLVVTGAHLNVAFGETFREIEADGYPIDAKIELELSSDTDTGMAKATGLAIVSFVDYFGGHRPHMVVLLGDRFELFAAAVAVSMLRIPIAHIAGGDTSEGAVDEFIRHSITKMSYLHFPTNEESRKRIIQLGEAPERVFNVGALNVDNIVSCPLLSCEELSSDLCFDLSGEYILITYHPATMDEDSDAAGVKELLNAVERFPEAKLLITKANADAGGRAINAALDAFAASRSNCAIFASLGSLRYLSAVKHASIVVGNSSSGLYETPSFGVPCVNIGDRQRGRLRAANVIDSIVETEAIEAAIRKALSEEFRSIVRETVSPFGDGRAAERIMEKIVFSLQDESIDLKKEFYNCY